MARQRFIINTFANMNMMQQQMASHMFGTLIKSQGPAPGSTEVNAMIRSMAKRQGYQGLIKPLNTPGQTYMHGAVDSALPPPMGAASAMPQGPSMMPGGAASMAGAPQMSAFGAVQMPYLQVAGGAVPVPNSVLGGGTTFSMGRQEARPGPGMRAPRNGSMMQGGISTMRGPPSVVSARGGSTGSTSGSAGRGASRSRARSHCSSTPKTPTLGGPMFAANKTSGSHHRRSSSQRMPQLQPFGGPSGYGSGYAASDGSRMLQPSSLGSDRVSMSNSAFMQSNSHLQSCSSFQAPPPQRRSRRHSTNGGAPALSRPSSGPMAYPPRQHSGQSAYGSPENSRRLSQPRSRQASTEAPAHAARPPKHSRSTSGARWELPRPSSGDMPSRGPSRGPSREGSPERMPPEFEHNRGNSSRVMAAVHAARRTLGGSRRRSSSRRRQSPTKSPARSPSPTRPPPIPRSAGDPNRGHKAKALPPPPLHGHVGPQHVPPPHSHPRPPVINNAMLRSNASSVTNSSFLFDSSSSGYSAQFDSLSSLPTSGPGAVAPQAPATPPQPGGSHHRRSNSGGASSGPLPPLALLPHPAAAPVAAMPSPPSSQRGGGGYPGLMPQQIASPGVRRGAPRRMTPQLAATPEVEEEVSSFMEV